MANEQSAQGVEVRIDCGLWDDLEPERLVIRAHTALCEQHPDFIGPVSVLFADDAAVRALNRDFRGKDKPTNVLSFPSDPDAPAELRYLGDVALAFQTCKAEASAQQKSLDDHVQHLLIHGMLHLIGYNHQDEASAAKMEALEISMLKGLGISDPYCYPRENEDE